MRVGERLETWAQDLRLARRHFARSPGFAAIVVVTLALGIGATTAIFSVVNSVLLRALPYRESDRIVQVAEVSAKGRENSVTDPTFDDWHAQSRSFASLAYYQAAGRAPALVGTRPLR